MPLTTCHWLLCVLSVCVCVCVGVCVCDANANCVATLSPAVSTVSINKFNVVCRSNVYFFSYLSVLLLFLFYGLLVEFNVNSRCLVKLFARCLVNNYIYIFFFRILHLVFLFLFIVFFLFLQSVCLSDSAQGVNFFANPVRSLFICIIIIILWHCCCHFLLTLFMLFFVLGTLANWVFGSLMPSPLFSYFYLLLYWYLHSH